MSELKSEKKESEWSDEILNPEEEEQPDSYEETYRDGSARNECWGKE